MPIALEIALLLMLGVFCQWLAWRLRMPAILPLLIAGLILGPGMGIMDPDAFLGDLLFPLVSLGVAVVLFEGSLTLRISDARQVSTMTSSVRIKLNERASHNPTPIICIHKARGT